MKQVLSAVKELDLFSSQIGLHMNKSFYYKTQVGGAASILVIVFITAFFWDRIDSFYHQKDVIVKSNRVYNPDPYLANAGSNRLMFALRIFQANRDFITRPYFNITVSQGVYEILENRQQVRNFNEIELEPCTSQHWEQIQSPGNFSELFSKFGEDFLCPVLGQELLMQGMFSSEKFMFLNIKVTPCVTPNDPSRKWNPVCAPAEEVEMITARDGFHGMNIYHSNYVLNQDSPDQPYTPYINDKLYFTFVPEKMTTLCDIYFQEITLKTDKSLISFSEYDQLDFLSQENNDIRQTVQLSRQDGVYVELTLRLSPYVSTVTRSFKKITQLMSELGGFIQIVFACVGLLVVRYNSFKFIVDLANNLYSFDKQSKDKKEDHNTSPVKEVPSKAKEQIDNNKTNIISMNKKQTLKRKDSSISNNNSDTPNSPFRLSSKFIPEAPSFSYPRNNQLKQIPNTETDQNPLFNSIIELHKTVNQSSSPHNNNSNPNQSNHINNLVLPSNTVNMNSSRISNSGAYSSFAYCSPSAIINKRHKKQSSIIKAISPGQMHFKDFLNNNNNTSKDVFFPATQPTNVPFQSVDCLTELSSPKESPAQRMQKTVQQQIFRKSQKFISYQKSEKERQQQIENFQMLENQGKKGYLISQFNKIILANTKLKIGIEYFISKLTFSKICNSETNQYIEKATELIHTDLDICNILDKIQQVDKLKNIIFDRNQLMLFNFHQKPKIQLSTETSNPLETMGLQSIAKRLKQINFSKATISNSSSNHKKGVLSQIITWDSVDSYKKLYNSYSAIQHFAENEQSTAIMNKKLIRCLGNEVLSVFELSEAIGDQKKEDFVFAREQTESLRMIPIPRAHTPSIFNRQKQNSEVVNNSGHNFEEGAVECSEKLKQDETTVEKEEKEQIFPWRCSHRQISQYASEGNLTGEDKKTKKQQKQSKLRRGVPSIEDDISVNYCGISIEEKKKKTEFDQSNNNSNYHQSYSSEIVFCMEVEDPSTTDIPSEQLAQEKGIQLQQTMQIKKHI